MKIKNILASVVLGTMLIQPVIANAEESTSKQVEDNSKVPGYGLGVSPASIYDEQLDYGESKVFTFKVANETYNYSGKPADINVSAVLENEYGEEIDSENMITFDKTKINVEPNTEVKVNATITLKDKKVESGNYKFYITFSMKIDNVGVGSQTSVIRVPVSIFFGDKETYQKAKVDYDLLDAYVAFDEERTTVIGESFHDCVKLINPLNTFDVFRDISYRPIFNFKELGSNESRLDINNSIMTTLRRVSTQGKTNDFKYVHYEKSQLNKKITNMKLNSDGLELWLDSKGEDKVYVNCNGDMASSIYQSVYKYLTENKQSGNYTLDQWMDIITVPRNRYYKKKYPTFYATCKNNSEIPVTLTCKSQIFKDGVLFSKEDESDKDDNGELKFTSGTIASGKEGKIVQIISKKELTEGMYEVKYNAKFRTLEKDGSLKFEVKQQRQIVKIVCIVFMIVWYYLIYRIIKWLLSKLLGIKCRLIINEELCKEQDVKILKDWKFKDNEEENKNDEEK